MRFIEGAPKRPEEVLATRPAPQAVAEYTRLAEIEEMLNPSERVRLRNQLPNPESTEGIRRRRSDEG